MKRVVVLSALLMACGPALAQEIPNGLSMNGIGNIQIGIPVDRLELQLHTKLGYNQYKDHGCSNMTTPKLENSGLGFMIENKLLTRVSVEYIGKSDIPETIKTDTGVGLGSREADVLKAYPGAKVVPNPADPTWHTIILETPDRTRGIVFETNGVSVKSMRAGLNPAIATKDGCP